MSIGTDELQMTVVGEVDYDSSRIMMRNQFNDELEVDASYLPKGSGVPQIGERWIVSKKYGKWVLDTKIGLDAPITIEGDLSADASSILSQIISGLAARGIIVNGTTNAPVDPVLDDDTDPNPDGTVPDWFAEEFEPADEDPTYDPPVNANDQSTDHGQEDQHPQPQGKYSYLTIGTFNDYFGLGTARVSAEWQKLRQTRLDVLGWQEADSPHRDAFYDALGTSDEWGLYRPGVEGTSALVGTSAREVPIAWRLSECRLLASGFSHLAPDEGPGYPDRWATWVRLLHIPSGLRFTVINTHLETNAMRYGFPNVTEFATRVTHYETCLDSLVTLVQTHAVHGPVWCIGDFNYHWERAVKLGPVPQTPWARFKTLGMSNNYLTLGFPAHKTHKDSGWIDYQWFKFDVVGGITLVWQKVLTGYYSDHLPLLCTYRIKNRQSNKTRQKKPKKR